MARYSSRELKAFAQRGAEARVAELQAEITALTRQFKLRGVASDRPRRRRSSMTAAQRADVSKRMKAYWAARRKAKKS